MSSYLGLYKNTSVRNECYQRKVVFYHVGVVTLVDITIDMQMKMQKPRRPHHPWDVPTGDAALGPASPGAPMEVQEGF